MRAKECQHLGGTTACVMRAVTATGDFSQLLAPHQFDDDDRPPKLFMGDSWFGSVKSAANVGLAGHHAIFVVKTAHARSPKKCSEETMQDMPGEHGSHWKGGQKKRALILHPLGASATKKL